MGRADCEREGNTKDNLLLLMSCGWGILVAPTPHLGEQFKMSLDFLFVQLFWRLLSAFGLHFHWGSNGGRSQISLHLIWREAQASFPGSVMEYVLVCVCASVWWHSVSDSVQLDSILSVVQRKELRRSPAPLWWDVFTAITDFLGVRKATAFWWQNINVQKLSFSIYIDKIHITSICYVSQQSYLYREKLWTLDILLANVSVWKEVWPLVFKSTEIIVPPDIWEPSSNI